MRNTFLMLSAAGLAIVPTAASSQSSYRSLPVRYVQEAQQQHAALVTQFGGAETGARAAYVDGIGRRMAVQSGVNPQLFRFTTLNSAVENAFAVPGGYIYITRQLMGIMNDEAELAFVVGHEVGHVAANHAQQREAATTRGTLASVLGAVLGSVLGGGFGNILSQGVQQFAQFRVLSFSRQQEYEADQLGIRYLARTGYDPNASASMLAALGRSTALEARVQGRDSRSTPEWAQTHPNSESRVRQAAGLAQQTGLAGRGVRNRDQFLNQLDGITVDDDPEQGVIDGRTFTHPDLRLQFTVPVGYLMQNGTDAVTIAGSAGKAQFTTGRFNGNLDTYISSELQQLTGGRTQLQLIDRNRTTINGLPASYVLARANTSSGAVDVGIFAYAFSPTQAYHFVTLSQAGRGIGPFGSMVNSLRRISAAEGAAIRPRVIDVVIVRPGETVQSLSSRMAYRNFQVDRFLSLNGLPAGARLVPGQRVKLVVYGTRTR